MTSGKFLPRQILTTWHPIIFIMKRPCDHQPARFAASVQSRPVRFTMMNSFSTSARPRFRLLSGCAIQMLLISDLLLAGSLCAPAADLGALPAPVARPVDFLKDIQPILARSCYSCHGPEKQKADLRWDSKATVFRQGEHGPLLVPGDS